MLEKIFDKDKKRVSEFLISKPKSQPKNFSEWNGPSVLSGSCVMEGKIKKYSILSYSEFFTGKNYFLKNSFSNSLSKGVFLLQKIFSWSSSQPSKWKMHLPSFCKVFFFLLRIFLKDFVEIYFRLWNRRSLLEMMKNVYWKKWHLKRSTSYFK